MLLNYRIGYPDLIIKLREKIYQEGLEDSVYVRKTDRKLIQNVHRFIYLLDSSDEPLMDDPTQPPEKWWWHLHSVAKVYRKRRKYWRQRSKENPYFYINYSHGRALGFTEGNRPYR